MCVCARTCVRCGSGDLPFTLTTTPEEDRCNTNDDDTQRNADDNGLRQTTITHTHTHRAIYVNARTFVHAHVYTGCDSTESSALAASQTDTLAARMVVVVYVCRMVFACHPTGIENKLQQYHEQQRTITNKMYHAVPV